MNLITLGNLQLIPALLLSDFEDGKYNNPWRGGNWDEYQRGKNEAAWNKRVLGESTGTPTGFKGGTPGDSAGGNGGAGGCILMLLLVFLLPLTVASAVIAFISFFVFRFYLSTLGEESKTLPFGKMFTKLFKTSFVYITVLALLVSLAWMAQGFIGLYFAKASHTPGNIFKSIMTVFILLQIPSVFISGIILKKEMVAFPGFHGTKGYWKATFFTTIMAALFLLLSSHVVLNAVHFFAEDTPNYMFH